MRFLSSLLVAILACQLVAAAEEKISYTGYKLYRLHCDTREQMEFIHELEGQDPDVDIWNQLFKSEHMFTDVVIAPRSQLKYRQMLTARSIRVEVLNENVQDMLDYQERTMEKPPKTGTRNILQKYARYGEMINFLQELVEAHPTLAKIEEAGLTVEGRKMYVFTLSSPGSPKTRKLWLDFGIHAREWVSPSAGIYIADRLIKDYNKGVPDIVALFDRYQIEIMPSVNPDGYEFSHTNTRLWRKNRKAALLCPGVDLNRNFQWKWNSGGASSITCAENYAGPSAGSEPETQVVQKWLANYPSQYEAFYTVHSYGNYLLLPFGHIANSPQNKPSNWDDLLKVATVGQKTWSESYGQTIIMGNSADALYVTTGTSSDYAQDILKVPYSYTLECRPAADSADAATYGFALPEDKNAEIGPEIYATIVSMTHELIKIQSGK